MFDPRLPAHCAPSNEILHHLSSHFHTCIPTPLALISTAFGILSIVSWLFSQLPQIYKNWSISSTSGLSFLFLLAWGLGDLSNLLGAAFTHQAAWQVVIGSYYVFVDFCLVSQWIWYEKLGHGKSAHLAWRNKNGQSDEWPDNGMGDVIIQGVSPPSWADSRLADRQKSSDKGAQGDCIKIPEPRVQFRAPIFGDKPSEQGESATSSPQAISDGRRSLWSHTFSPTSAQSPRTVTAIAGMASLARAAPVRNPLQVSTGAASAAPSALAFAGFLFSWTSTVLYLGSRLPQLIKNYQRQSMAGLSPQLFLAAFCGNLFYSLALVTNPCAWSDFEPYGAGGWVDAEGSRRVEWVAAALPFFLGAAGVLGLDACVGLQFLLYGDNHTQLVVVDKGKRDKRSWRRFSGWMRGWIPNVEAEAREEDERLLAYHDRVGETYGTT